MRPLPSEYYAHSDVLHLSRDLLGKVLCTHIDGERTSGVITETEAYRAPEDRASHAFGGRRTKRNEAMYSQGGVAYVYLCYGIHSLFNVVTNQAEIPHAILVRAIHPIEGVDTMLTRRNKTMVKTTLTTGPGALSQALGITTQHNTSSLTSETIWIEDRGIAIPSQEIITGPRVGIDYAGEDALLPWRFRWVSHNEMRSRQPGEQHREGLGLA